MHRVTPEPVGRGNHAIAALEHPSYVGGNSLYEKQLAGGRPDLLGRFLGRHQSVHQLVGGHENSGGDGLKCFYVPAHRSRRGFRFQQAPAGIVDSSPQLLQLRELVA